MNLSLSPTTEDKQMLEQFKQSVRIVTNVELIIRDHAVKADDFHTVLEALNYILNLKKTLQTAVENEEKKHGLILPAKTLDLPPGVKA